MENIREELIKKAARDYAKDKSSAPVFRKAHERDFKEGVKWACDFLQSHSKEDGLYCQYCGHKKDFIIDTDINSGIVCKNQLCKGK